MLNRSSTLAVLALVSAAGVAAAQTSVSVVAGRLTLTTPGTDQNVKIEMKEGAGIARVFGFPGIADGTSYTGINALTVNTGAGRDEVQFDLEQPGSLDVRSNTGAGDALTKVQWKIIPGAGAVTAGLTLSSAAGGLQLAEVGFDSETLNNAQININTGNASEVTTKVNSTVLASALGVNFFATGAKTTFELTSAAARLNAGLRGNHAAGMNEVKYVLNQLRPATVAVVTDTTLGNGMDKLEAIVGAPGSAITLSGRVLAGGGDDFVNVISEGTSTVNGLSLTGGAGNDFLANEVKGRFQLSQTLGASIFAGSGNDILILRTDTAIVGTGLPNDVEPIIDGGADFDLYNAFGRILNCEGRL